MDSRHESIDQEILNRFIAFINQFISANIDEILIKEWLANDIKRISSAIYAYAHMDVDVVDIIAKENFLSLDMIVLPSVDDATLCSIERKNSDFVHLLGEIHTIATKRNNVDMGEHQFYAEMQKILASYSL